MGPLSKGKKTIADIPDFKRRKAKVGKRAPKAANVTETAFQATSINVKNQSSTIDRVISNSQSSSSLYSSRGRSIYELSNQLQHPASAARISAAKGLRDIITGGTVLSAPSASKEQKQQHNKLILNNLSVLIATCSKCCIDEEKEVREIGGVLSLREIIIKLQQYANSLTSLTTLSFSSAPSTFVTKQLKPFSPLLVAYITAALNSLDPKIRVTGSNVVHVLALNVPDLVASNVDVLIPPFVRLLSERSGSKTIQNLTSHNSKSIDAMSPNPGSMKKNDRNKRKRKRNANTIAEPGDFEVAEKSVKTVTDPTLVSNLQALAAVLYSLPSRDGFAELSKTLEEELTDKVPDAIVVEGGKICNAVMYYRKPILSREMRVIRSIHDCTSSLMIGENTNRSHPKTLQLGSKITYDLLSRIREILIEVSQSPLAIESGLQIHCSSDLVHISPAIKILRFFLQSYCSDVSLMLPKDAKDATYVASKDQNRMKKLVQNLARVVTECFLVGSDIDDTDCLRDVQEANANLCISLQCLSSLTLTCKGFDETRKEWLELVASFVQQTLENDENLFADKESSSIVDLMPDKDGTNDQNGDINQIKFSTSKSLLDVFVYLVLPNKSRNFLRLGKENENQRSMIDAFCSVFFNHERKLNHCMACSIISRYAIQIAISMYRICDYVLETVEDLFGPAVLDVPLCIVNYLSHWKDSYCTESSMCITFLEKILRHNNISATTNEITSDGTCVGRTKLNLLESFRAGMEQYFVIEDEKTSDSVLPISPSCCFESMPPVLQRQIVCFIVLLKYPTDVTLTNLGRVCSRHRLYQNELKDLAPGTESIDNIVIGESEASFIVQTIHSIRKTISMQKYLAFLMDSTGLMQLHSVTCLPRFSKDSSVTFPDHFISSIDKGTSIICSCLMDSAIDKVLPKLEQLFVAFLQRCTRAASDKIPLNEPNVVCSRAVIAILAMLSLGLSESDSQLELLSLGLVSENFSTIIVASMVGILIHVTQISKEDSDDSMTYKLLKPIQALLNIQKDYAFEIFQLLVLKLNETESVNDKETILEVLCMMMKDKDFRRPLYGKLEKLHIQVKEINLHYQDGPLEELTNRILAQLELARKVN